MKFWPAGGVSGVRRVMSATRGRYAVAGRRGGRRTRTAHEDGARGRRTRTVRRAASKESNERGGWRAEAEQCEQVPPSLRLRTARTCSVARAVVGTRTDGAVLALPAGAADALARFARAMVVALVWARAQRAIQSPPARVAVAGGVVAEPIVRAVRRAHAWATRGREEEAEGKATRASGFQSDGAHAA